MTALVTPEQLKQAEDRWKKLRDAHDPEAPAAEREFQRLAREQTESLQTRNYQNLISRMLR